MAVRGGARGLPSDFRLADRVVACMAHDLDPDETAFALRALPFRISPEDGAFDATPLFGWEHGRHAAAALVRQIGDRAVGRAHDRLDGIVLAFWEQLAPDQGDADLRQVGPCLRQALHRRLRAIGLSCVELEAQVQAFARSRDPADAPSFFAGTQRWGDYNALLLRLAAARPAEDVASTSADVGTAISARTESLAISEVAASWSIKPRRVGDGGAMRRDGIARRCDDGAALAALLATAAVAACACDPDYAGGHGDQHALRSAFAANVWFKPCRIASDHDGDAVEPSWSELEIVGRVSST